MLNESNLRYYKADLATEWERQLTTRKRAERTQLDVRSLIVPPCHWSRQLFNFRAPSSPDVPVLFLNQPTDEIGTSAGLSLGLRLGYW